MSTADQVSQALAGTPGWDAGQNTFVESLGGTAVDASLQLLQEVGFVTADDPKFLGTLEAVERRLRHGNHLYRYEEADDFGKPTTAFTVCTFWYVNALVAVGHLREARAMFENVLRCCNHVGLLSEDVDPHTGELWGNFPQSYSLVGLIISAVRLSHSWEEAFWRGRPIKEGTAYPSPRLASADRGRPVVQGRNAV